MSDLEQVQSKGDLLSIAVKSGGDFPTAPEGLHTVTVKHATFSMRENTIEPAKGLIPTVMIIVNTEEVDEDGNQYRMPIFLSVSNNEKSNMYKFFSDVMGQEVPVHSGRIAFKQTVVTKEDGKEIVYLDQFQGLKFQVLVKHKKKDDGTIREKIESYLCDKAGKAANYELFCSDSALAKDTQEAIISPEPAEPAVKKK